MEVPFYTHNMIMDAMYFDKRGEGEKLTEMMGHPELFRTFECGNGETYLFKACEYTLRAVKFFLQHCDINARDDDGCTILWSIVYYGTEEILRYVLPLMSSEAIATQNNDGFTVLHIAFRSMKGFRHIPLLLEYATEEMKATLDNHGKTYDECVSSCKGDYYTATSPLDNYMRPSTFTREWKDRNRVQTLSQYGRSPLQPAYEFANITQMMGRIERLPTSSIPTSSAQSRIGESISFEQQVARAFYALPQDVRDGKRELGINDLPSDPMVKQGVIAILTSLGIERCKMKIAEESAKSSSSSE